MVHWRRKIFDLHEAQPTATTTGFLARIQQIYRIEEEIRGLPAAERLVIRRARSRPLVQELGRFAKQQRALMSPRSETATALNYGLRRWRAFNRFLYNGALEIDNLIAERSIRGVTIGRRNWLFAGSEEGGKRGQNLEHHRDVQSVWRRTRSLPRRRHGKDRGRLARLALGRTDAVELGAEI